MSQKLIITSIIIIVILAGVVGYFVITKEQESPMPAQQTSSGEMDETDKIEKTNELPIKTDELKVKSVKTIIEDMRLTGTTGKHPKFSNDEKRIVYREMRGDESGMWIVNVDGTGLKKLTNEFPTGGGTYDFGWSPDDKFIFYKTQSFYPVVPTLLELKVIEVETGIIKSVFQTPSSFNIASPQWISQKKIAFVHIDEPNLPNTSVKVVDVNLGKVVQSSKEITLYFWYIKGSSKASPGQRMTIASVSTDGTVREITPDGAVSVPLVFPNGKRIAYAANDGLVIMNIDGSNPKIISSEITAGTDPALSPSGDMFAYNKTRDDGRVLLESDIYVMNIDGTGEKRLTKSGNKMAMEPSWSPDGSKIAVFYYGTGEIGVIEIEKSN